MPYQITEEPHFFRIVLFGDITPHDIASLGDAIAAIDRVRPVTPNGLADFSQVTGMDLTYPAVLAYAERRKAHPLANRVKSAIVAPCPVQVGFARMYQILNDHPQVEIQIFTTVAEAETWLRADEAAVGK
jgi:hypothetical protein